jgi:hypothetical protein
VKEKPIIFSAEMVRAILDGRKTQTRRIMVLQPTIKPSLRNDEKYRIIASWPGESELDGFECHCPYGRAGDRLWVRETWQMKGLVWGKPANWAKAAAKSAFHYRATDNGEWKSYWGGWRSPIHMPRWASRITLEITGVKVERLNEISRADAETEGTWAAVSLDRSIQDMAASVGLSEGRRQVELVDYFREIWERINGKGSWAANPWVWAITFKRISQPDAQRDGEGGRDEMGNEGGVG